MSALDDANKAADILIAEALKVKQQRDELLAACEDVIEACEEECRDDPSCVRERVWADRLNEAIAKVKGS